jgi:hypothetical protein
MRGSGIAPGDPKVQTATGKKGERPTSSCVWRAWKAGFFGLVLVLVWCNGLAAMIGGLGWLLKCSPGGSSNNLNSRGLFVLLRWPCVLLRWPCVLPRPGCET